MTPNSGPRLGAWITMNSPSAVEQIAQLGFDFVCLDGQHGLLGYTEIRDGLLAITAGGSATPFVRVTANDAGEIGRVLDAGAQGVIVPLVDTAEDARRAVRAARYPISGGGRSYSPVRLGRHFGSTPAQTDGNVTVLAMIETRSGLEHAEQILDTEGIDGIFVGPYDLSLALGAVVPFAEEVVEELEDALSGLSAAAEKRGKIAGIYCGSGADARRRIEQGFGLLNTATDIVALREGMGQELREARSSITPD